MSRLLWLCRPRAAALVIAAAVLVVGSLSAPAPAQAIDLFPIDDIAGNVAGSALHFAGDQVAGAAVAALLGVIKFFVGDLDRELGRQLVHFLLGVNDFTNPSYRALNTYAGYVQAIAWGLLGLVFTAATLRYWLAGFAGAGAHDALQALGRCAGAAAALVALAPAWHLATIAVNRLTYALISGPGVGDQADKVFVGALSVQVVPGAAAPFAGIVLVGSLIAAVALLITKTLMAAALAVLYLGAPLAIVVAPIDELAWLSRAALQSAVAILLWPVLTALCFAAFALLSTDAVATGGGSGVLGQLTRSLAGLAALIVAWRLPLAVLRQGLVSSSVPAMRGLAHPARAVALAARRSPVPAR